MTFIFYALFLIIAFLTEDYNKDIRDKNLSKEEKNKDNIYVGLNSLYCILAFIGVFSSQWILFLLLIAISFFPKINKYWIFIDMILSLAIAFFIIINRYHLHINIYNLIF